jgi:hypothetical protein
MCRKRRSINKGRTKRKEKIKEEEWRKGNKNN